MGSILVSGWGPGAQQFSPSLRSPVCSGSPQGPQEKAGEGLGASGTPTAHSGGLGQTGFIMLLPSLTGFAQLDGIRELVSLKHKYLQSFMRWMVYTRCPCVPRHENRLGSLSQTQRQGPSCLCCTRIPRAGAGAGAGGRESFLVSQMILLQPVGRPTHTHIHRTPKSTLYHKPGEE